MSLLRSYLGGTSLLAAGILCFSTNVSSAAESGEWKSLFNGTNLDGWYVFIAGQNERNKDTNHLVQIENGAVHMYKDVAAGSTQPFGYVATEKEFENYRLRLEFKWGEKKFAPRANVKRDAGLIYHAGYDRVWPRGVECQIQEGDVGDIYTISTRLETTADPKTAEPKITITTNQTTGVVRTNRSTQPVFQEGGATVVQGGPTGSLRVIRSSMNEIDGWNTVEVIVRGDSATHIINGKLNNHCEKIQEMRDGTWTPLNKGRIALQLEGAEVLYRKIEIQELKE